MNCDRAATKRPHRYGGYKRLATDPVAFVRHCQRRACRGEDVLKITAEQIAALDARIAEGKAPYGETSSKHLIGRARRTGRLVLIRVGA